jgi:hypothetical protein
MCPLKRHFHRGGPKVLARDEWPLDVSFDWPLHCLLLMSMAPQNSILTSSWEFFTTLEYEWSVFRGRRPYRWTIWVCGHRHLTLASSATPKPLPDLLVL